MRMVAPSEVPVDGSWHRQAETAKCSCGETVAEHELVEVREGARLRVVHAGPCKAEGCGCGSPR